MKYSLLSPDELLDALRETYSMSAGASCQLLRRGLHDTYVIVTAHERYVVRVYRAGSRSPADVAYELELLTHLAAKRVSVSAPIPDKEGRLIQLLPAPEGVRPVVVFEYAHGTSLSWTETESRLAGSLLAEIHMASDDFTSAHVRASHDLAYLVDQPIAAVTRFLEHRPGDCAFLTDFAARIRDRVTAVAGELEWGVCHGDFGAKNIHIDRAGRVTAFDFDRCGPGWRATDFALVMWAAVGRRRQAMWQAFVQGYRGTRSLACVDFRAVSLFHAVSLVSVLGLLATNADTWGLARIDDVALDGWLTSLRTWEAEQTVMAAGEDT